MNQLYRLRKEDILHDIDIEWCKFLKTHHQNLTDEVLAAACLVSYLYRQGDVCLRLDYYADTDAFEETGIDLKLPKLTDWKQKLTASPVVGNPGDFKPLILDAGHRLYLHKLWYHENSLAKRLIAKSRQNTEDIDLKMLRNGLNRLFPESSGALDWQRVAAALSVHNKLSVISGGPGTGKTSTVVRILALLLEQAEACETKPAIALAAPTGKAAARLQQSVVLSKEELNVEASVRDNIPDEAVTLHQLLGARRHTSKLKYNEDRPLPYDIVVVDEVSMVDQALMHKLLQALLKGSKLILLGDKDQLASVEAGSVLGDICMHADNSFSTEISDWLRSESINLTEENITDNPKNLTDNITLLTKSYRFDERSSIARLADNVNKGEVEKALSLLKNPDNDGVHLLTVDGTEGLKKEIAKKATRFFQHLSKCTAPQSAFKRLANFRILCAHRSGPWGIEYINQLVENILQEKGVIPKYRQWYAGKPVIINVNDYSLGLYNGDTGICLPNGEGEYRIYFQHENKIKEIAPARLPDYNRAYALTIHKSQGSEFNNILLVLPDTPSRIVSRELIYTGITRARSTVEILSTKKTLRKGISTKLRRISGLSNRLWSN